jgi:hypothetical protein
MPSPEQNSLNQLIGDADPQDIIHHRLQPLEFNLESEIGVSPPIVECLPSTNTQKYSVEGLPEVVVRHQAGMPACGIRAAVTRAHAELGSHAIGSLPYVPVTTWDNETYVFTRRLYGDNLKTILAPGIPDACLQAVDQTFAAVAAYYHDGRLTGRPVLDTVHWSNDYMYGRTTGQTADAVTLVRLGDHVVSLKHGLGKSDTYGRFLLHLASTVVNTEQAVQRINRLQQSRDVLSDALDLAQVHIPPADKIGIALVRMTRYNLANSTTLDPDEDSEAFEEFQQ